MALPFKLANLSPGSPLIFVYAANYQYRRAGQRKRITGGGPTYTSWGKGETRTQAEASARGEAIEHLSSFYTGEESYILKSFEELGERAIHPNECMLYSESQLAHHASSSTSISGLFVPQPFDASQEVAWTTVQSLYHAQERYIPIAYCYFKCALPGNTYCVMDSNGHAAGDTREEAWLGGLLELIERDAVGIWWYNNVPAYRVELESFGNEYFERVQEYYTRLNQDVYVLDITTDIETPVFVAITRARNNRNKIRLGYGAGPNAERAIQRALSELHMWFVFPDERYESPSPQIHPWTYTDGEENTVTIGELQCLRCDASVPVKTSADYPVLDPKDPQEYFADCKKRIEDLDMEVLVLDQTRSQYGMPVTKVIVPGLRHYKRRLAPGRLYNVPVKLNRISTPLPEEKLNPFSLIN